MLPAPWEVAAAYADHWELLAEHGAITLAEIFIGLILGVQAGED